MQAGMRNHSNFTVVPVPAPVPGFLLVPVPVSVPVPAQRSKRKQIQLAYDCRLDVSQGGRTLCTNWLHTGADLIQAIVSYVRIKTRTLKKFFRATLTRRPYPMHSENSHLCEHREIPTFEGN